MRLRIATFNLENWKMSPSLEERIAVTRPQLLRIDADILCLQEGNGDPLPAGGRAPLALNRLIEGTQYQDFHVASTRDDAGFPFEERNLLILSRFPIVDFKQFLHVFTPPPMYGKVTAIPPETAQKVRWERPFLYAKIQVSSACLLHVINVHFKSKIPSSVNGQQLNRFVWKTVSGFAEGFFISSMKRVGQALEARVFIDTLFDADATANIIIVGDFNSDLDDVPVKAIRGEVEDTGNSTLAGRVMVPCEMTIPESSRFSLIHRGQGEMIDHILFSRPMLGTYRKTEVHNEILPDESVNAASDKTFPESDHAPVIAEFEVA